MGASWCKCFSILDWIVAVGTAFVTRAVGVRLAFQYPRLDRSGWNTQPLAHKTDLALPFQYPRLDRSGWNLEQIRFLLGAINVSVSSIGS